MSNETITPGTGALSYTGESVALIEDGPSGTRTNDFRGSSISEVCDEFIRVEVIDAPPRGLENEPNVLAVLASSIRNGDQTEPTVEKGEDSRGEDGILVFRSGARWPVQIVSVPVDSAHWKKVSAGRAEVQLTFDQAATWIYEAIAKKQRSWSESDRAGVVLALDARHCAQLAHERVIAAYRRLFGDPASLGFKEIWLVGPVKSRSRQIA